jgi:outer membrane protein TolC
MSVPSELLERRPDIAGAERRMAAANAQVGVTVAAYYPAITLSASGGFAGSNLSDWPKWPNRFWSVGASISEIVFEGGLRQAQTAQQTVTVTNNQYKSGTVNYLNVIVVQVAAKNSEITALNILGRRMTAAVLLVKALGGGWTASVPSSAGKPGDTGGKQRQPGETEPEPANREDER